MSYLLFCFFFGCFSPLCILWATSAVHCLEIRFQGIAEKGNRRSMCSFLHQPSTLCHLHYKQHPSVLDIVLRTFEPIISQSSLNMNYLGSYCAWKLKLNCWDKEWVIQLLLIIWQDAILCSIVDFAILCIPTVRIGCGNLLVSWSLFIVWVNIYR